MGYAKYISLCLICGYSLLEFLNKIFGESEFEVEHAKLVKQLNTEGYPNKKYINLIH